MRKSGDNITCTCTAARSGIRLTKNFIEMNMKMEELRLTTTKDIHRNVYTNMEEQQEAVKVTGRLN